MRPTTLLGVTGGACTALLAASALAQDIIVENGPFFTPAVVGLAGQDVSVLSTADGENIFGYGAQQNLGTRLTDEFEICEEATITSVVLQSYQSFETTPTIIGVTLQIWDGRPGDLATGPAVFGDPTTNVLTSVVFPIDLGDDGIHDIYRATDAAATNCDRHLQTVTIAIDPPLILPPGVYWLDWAFTGSGTSGPWQSPIPGAAGNGRQFILDDFEGPTWSNLVDEANDGVPFLVRGTGGGSCVGPCDGDISSPGTQGVPDGTVGVDDFLWVFANWGDCPGGTPGCAGDISSPGTQGVPDGTVGVDDFLWVFANWGDCPGGGLLAPNDDLADAYAMSGYGNQGYDLSRASQDGPGASCGTGPNLWYCWTATATESAVIVAEGATVAVYSNCSGSGSELACGFGGAIFAANQGQSYLVELIQAVPGVVGTAEMTIGAAIDFCVGAEDISLGLTAYDTTGATTDGPAHPPCGVGGDGGVTVNDHWFRYTAGSDGLLQVTTCEDLGGSATYDTDLVIYDGCDCSNLQFLDCNDDDFNNLCIDNFRSTITTPVVAGNCYLIRAGGFANPEDEGPGVLSLSMLPAIPNDECPDAIEISDGVTPFSTIGATGIEPAHPECDEQGDGGITVNDIWFTYTATQTGDLTISTCEDTGGTADYDTDIVAYDGCDCDNLVLLGCNDDSVLACGADLHSNLVVSVIEGNCYLIRLGGWASIYDDGTGGLNLTYEEITDPIACGIAEPIEIGQIVEGDTTGTVFDASAVACDPANGPEAGGFWYTIVGDGGTMTATTCSVITPPDGTQYDTRLAVYCGGSCGDLVCTNENIDDDLCFLGNFVGESTVQWCSDAGKTFTIFVGGELATDQGVFALQVTSDGVPCTPSAQAPACPLPENDLCADALPIFDGLTPFSTTSAGTDGPPNPAGECNDSGDTQTHHDIWYEYTATATGTLTLSTCEQTGGSAQYDTDLVIYTGCGVCADLEANFLGCNDDDGNNPCGGLPDYHSTLLVPVTSGSCYTVRVGGWSSADQGTGELFLGVN